MEAKAGGRKKKSSRGEVFSNHHYTEVVCETEGVGPAPKRMVDRLVQDSNLSAKKRGNIPVDF